MTSRHEVFLLFSRVQNSTILKTGFTKKINLMRFLYYNIVLLALHVVEVMGRKEGAILEKRALTTILEVTTGTTTKLVPRTTTLTSLVTTTGGHHRN